MFPFSVSHFSRSRSARPGRRPGLHLLVAKKKSIKFVAANALLGPPLPARKSPVLDQKSRAIIRWNKTTWICAMLRRFSVVSTPSQYGSGKCPGITFKYSKTAAYSNFVAIASRRNSLKMTEIYLRN